jgi:hypothetical protein
VKKERRVSQKRLQMGNSSQQQAFVVPTSYAPLRKQTKQKTMQGWVEYCKRIVDFSFFDNGFRTSSFLSSTALL